jgi:phosphatidylglycerophosphatase A
MTRLAVLLATSFGIGYIPFAPGTFGSIPGLAATWLARRGGGWWLEAAVMAVLFAVGGWAATRAEVHFGRIDPGPVVIDEVVGMMVTTAFLTLSAWGLVVAFLVFRACDIVKPFPARQCERLPGGLGVMTDDLMAGLWGHAIMRGLVWLFPQVLLP